MSIINHAATERMLLQPYASVRIDDTGTFAYTSGTAPFVHVQEGRDIIPVFEGQCLPFAANAVNVINPFSFPITIFWARNLPPNVPSVRSASDLKYSGKMQSRAALTLPNVAGGGPAGKKRGIGFIAKRGMYTLTINSPVVATNEVMTFRNASPEFAAIRGDGVMSLEPQVVRFDGSLNTNILCIGGYYSDTDITAWKAAAGYTESETRQIVNVATITAAMIDEETAVFFSVLETTSLSVNVLFTDFGDMSNDRR